MYSSIKIIGSNILNLFESKEFEKFYAHINENNVETLFEHSILVKEYAKVLIDRHKTGKTVSRLVDDFVIKNYQPNNHITAKEFITELFENTFVFHDLGKLNPEFQSNKMKNSKFKSIKNSLGSGHSKISAFAFIFNYLKLANNDMFSGNEKIINIFLVFSFSFSILKHHSSSISYLNEFEFSDEFVNDIYSIIDNKLLPFPKEQISNIGKMFNQRVLNEVDAIVSKEPFHLFVLLKLNYSLLTASDYYATTHYMKKWGKLEVDFGVFDNELKKKIVNNIENSKEYNLRTYKEIDGYEFLFPQETSTDNLNRLRLNLSVEVINGIRSNIDKNLFYIEAPTGGGKTNLSMLALSEFLRNDLINNQNMITKVFYVFPFTTLITQTFSVLKETLGLDDSEIVQVHSKAGFSSKNKHGDYGTDRENIIDYQFVNYPVALLSHIKFFDILKSNRKSENYLLHRLSNSVVIIDELQTYSPKEWDKVIYFINNYAKYFNIKFILMSATLPKIDKLLSDDAKNINFENDKVVSLIENKDRYFQNPNFSKRIKFDFSLLNDSDFDKEKKEEFLKKLWLKIEKESVHYKKNYKLNRVHTIIEFIFKKTASEFIELVNNENDFFDEVFILSGTTLEPRRREIISKLKSDESAKKNILLITTQVVEAGVDIDMDLGFKDSSLIDSDEQLAGRINRNVSKEQCKLYLFDLDDANIIYGEDARYKKVQNELSSDYFMILQTKKFDMVYDSVMDDRKQFNKSDDSINLKDYLSSIRKLNFNSVDQDFKLIDDGLNNVTMFVPIEIPVNIPNSTEKNFTQNELDFLEYRGEYFENKKNISGAVVWMLYENAITNKDEDFVNQKIQIITLQGLVSKFAFSVGIYSKAFKNIKTSGNVEEKYGFYYLLNVSEVYDYRTGIKNLTFEDTNFW